MVTPARESAPSLVPPKVWIVLYPHAPPTVEGGCMAKTVPALEVEPALLVVPKSAPAVSKTTPPTGLAPSEFPPLKVRITVSVQLPPATDGGESSNTTPHHKDVA